MTHPEACKMAKEIADALAAKFRVLDRSDLLAPEPGRVYQVIYRAITRQAG